MGFLGNLVKVFPGLASRPLYISGESYAGTYIVSSNASWLILRSHIDLALYIKDLLRNDKPSCKDYQNRHRGWYHSGSCCIWTCPSGASSIYPCGLYLRLWQLTVIETYPQLIGYDPDVFNYFKEQYVRYLFSINDEGTPMNAGATYVVITSPFHILRLSLYHLSTLLVRPLEMCHGLRRLHASKKLLPCRNYSVVPKCPTDRTSRRSSSESETSLAGPMVR